MTDLDYEYEERAAILEYDAGLSRAESERLALEMIREREDIGVETEEDRE